MEAKHVLSPACFSTFQIKYYEPSKLSLFVHLVCFSTFQIKYDVASLFLHQRRYATSNTAFSQLLQRTTGSIIIIDF